MYNPHTSRMINGKYLPLRAKRSITQVVRQPKSSSDTPPVASKPTPSAYEKALKQFQNICFQPKFPLIVTAYTVTSHLGDYYQKSVARLTRSCIRFNLPHIVYPLTSVNNWLHGCNLKPTVILQALHTFRRPILWIDADAEIYQYPQIFEEPFKYDIALTAEAPPSGHWLSGTFYCKPSTIDFIDKWRQITPQSSDQDKDADEVTLRNLWHDLDPAARPTIHLLPEQYNTVVHTKTDLSHVVIGHYIRHDIAPLRNCQAVPVPEL